MIRRLFAELWTFNPFYSKLVRPYLEYIMRTSSPKLIANVDCLATKLVNGFRLLAIRITTVPAGPSLSNERRLHGCLIATYNVFTEGVDLAWEITLSKLCLGPSRRIRRKKFLLVFEQALSLYRDHPLPLTHQGIFFQGVLRFCPPFSPFYH